MKKLNKFIAGMLVSFVSVTGVHAAETVECSDPSAVAQVGESCYAKLSEAFTEATDKQTVILKDDIVVSTAESAGFINLTTSADLTFDLNGHVISSNKATYAAFYVNNGKKLTITDTSDAKTGKIEHTGNGSAVRVQTGELTLTGGTYTADKEVTYNVGAIEVGSKSSKTIDTYRATLIVEDGATITDGCITVFGKESKVTINGGTITGPSFAISGNGSSADEDDATIDSLIEINGGKLESTGNAAIYHPQSGTLNITGGDIIGKIGIVARGGKVNVSKNAHIVATGSADETISTGDAKDAEGKPVELPTGVGIVIDNTEVYPDVENVKATVTGGNFETDVASAAVYKVEELEDKEPTDLIEVKGGTFTVGEKADESVLTYVVSSGDKELGQSESGVIGTLHKVTFEEPENGTIEVPANAAEGETFTITVEPAEGYKVSKVLVNGTEITPNADGTYTYTMGEANVTVTAEFTKIEASGDVPATTPDDETTSDETEEETPNTLDKAPIYLTIGAVALTSVTALGYIVKKKLED